MKFTIFSTLFLAAATIATPLADPDFDGLYALAESDALEKRQTDNRDPDIPFRFTSRFRVNAVPGQVVDSMNQSTGGLAGASGIYLLALNSDLNQICWNITLRNFRGRYESAADTATHLHESARGKSGPPRIAFPNPRGLEPNVLRISLGCTRGPFRTGLTSNSTMQDTGAGFHVKQIENNPSAFNVDSHSSLAVPGAVRGQLPS